MRGEGSAAAVLCAADRSDIWGNGARESSVLRRSSLHARSLAQFQMLRRPHQRIRVPGARSLGLIGRHRVMDDAVVDSF